jgi:hypothetical protein
MGRPPPEATDMIILHGGAESVGQLFALFGWAAAGVLLVLGTSGAIVYLRRRWRTRPPGFFRVHLSTFIIVMFIAAVLVGLNVVPRIVAAEETNIKIFKLAMDESNEIFVPFDCVQRGWPAYHHFSFKELKTWSHLKLDILALDVAVALALLAAVAVACEWRIRRRKPALPTGS